LASTIHLTPPELAQQIAAYAVEQLRESEFPIQFGDPAVGTGAFYSALLQVLPRSKIASAIGVDINDRQVAAAHWRWSHQGMQVMRGDYLHMGSLPLRTLILANPPYLRHQSIPAPYKKELCERSSVVSGYRVSGRSGLYVYFLLLSHAWMRPDALAAWLIPSEFMQTAYGQALRQYLTEKVQLLRIHQFGHEDPQFENVKVLPAVVVFRNRRASAAGEVLFTVGGGMRRPMVSQRVPLAKLARQSRWIIPGRQVASRERSHLKIGDLFSIKRGIATGANAFFVMERSVARDRGIPEAFLKPLLPNARSLKTDVVEDCGDGYPRLSPQMCLLDSDVPESVIRRRFPRVSRYLSTATHLGIRNRNLIRSRTPWYKQERREPAIFLCTYMGRRRRGHVPIRFVWNKSRAVATNTYLLLYPRAGMEVLLREPENAQRVFALLQRAARESMGESWRMHGEGLVKIEPGELGRVALPSDASWLDRGVTGDLPFEQIAPHDVQGALPLQYS